MTFSFQPLIRGTGKLDLLTCAEYVPTAGKIVSIARWIIDVIGGKLWFNLYAKGDISLNGTIYFNQAKKTALTSTTAITIGVELGVAIAADVKKLNFEATKKTKGEKAKYGGEISATGETSISFKSSIGLDKKGTFIELSVDFGGLVAVVNAKLDVDLLIVGVKNKACTLIEPIPSLFKQTMYIL